MASTQVEDLVLLRVDEECANLQADGHYLEALDYMERSLDLNEELIHRPHATFFLRAAGHSMVGAGIHDGDLLIVDRAATPQPGLVVVAIVDGDFTLKRLSQTNDGLALEAEHPNYRPIAVGEATDVRIWGVVTFVVHRP